MTPPNLAARASPIANTPVQHGDDSPNASLQATWAIRVIARSGKVVPSILGVKVDKRHIKLLLNSYLRFFVHFHFPCCFPAKRLDFFADCMCLPSVGIGTGPSLKKVVPSILWTKKDKWRLSARPA